MVKDNIEMGNMIIKRLSLVLKPRKLVDIHIQSASLELIIKVFENTIKKGVKRIKLVPSLKNHNSYVD